MTKKLIVVAGNIGAGKTSLTERIGARMGWLTGYESVSDNPYLPDFYADMKTWSFHLQVYFLGHRAKQYLDIANDSRSAILDRSIYEDAYIFAPNLHSMGLMSTRDFENYFTLFNLISSLISPPVLVIFLRASIPTLVKQIQQRGRKYESSIRLDYLKKLNDRYESWATAYNLGKIISIDIDNHNFPENPEHLSVVIDKINAQIHGLF